MEEKRYQCAKCKKLTLRGNLRIVNGVGVCLLCVPKTTKTAADKEIEKFFENPTPVNLDLEYEQYKRARFGYHKRVGHGIYKIYYNNPPKAKQYFEQLGGDV